MASQQPQGDGLIVGINVTPMVDVVLVLLVIMMVSATYIVSQTLRVNLPTSSSSDGSTASPSIVTIGADRSLRWGEEPVTEAQLVGRFTRRVCDTM
jgi:biopolymer transport protein ExbD